MGGHVLMAGSPAAPIRSLLGASLEEGRTPTEENAPRPGNSLTVCRGGILAQVHMLAPLQENRTIVHQ